MVGSSIRKLRNARKLTQKDLAAALGVTRQAICMWERNKRDLKATTLNKVANFFNVSVNEIIEPLEYGERLQHVAAQEDMNQGYRNWQTLTALTEEEGKMNAQGRKRVVSFELHAPKANRVALSGDFNSWDKNGLPMKRDKNGVWRTGLNLKPGRYEYKFIVDGQWLNDPSNNKTVTNTYGSVNSVKEIPVAVSVKE